MQKPIATSPLHDVKLLELPGPRDTPHYLSFVEENTDIVPFSIKRVYWLHDLTKGVVRGCHGHKELQQLMVCLSGAVDVVLRDFDDQRTYKLDRPSLGLLLPAGLWREVSVSATCKTTASVMNLASMVYDENDYMRDFNDYCTWFKSRDL